ncbi:tripeptidyl-peptidase SED4 [Paracoccidioides brasiliensis]|nr:tripeptidyl-peptidase SED4 [Paracoccidioides brasiliensis]
MKRPIQNEQDLEQLHYLLSLSDEELTSPSYHFIRGATPMFASIIINLNSICPAEGNPVLEFLNPLLYSLRGAGFNDIIHGRSGGCTGKSTASGLSAPHTPGAGGMQLSDGTL